MSALRGEIGLVRARPGSLGVSFAAVLVAGTVLAWWLGALNRGPAANWTLLVSLVLWQPLMEEALFRGVLQGYLLQTVWGGRRLGLLSAANAVCAALFAAAHLVHQPPLWAVATVFPGLLFGFYRERSGSLWPAMVLHSAFNSGFFLAPLFRF